MAPLNESTAANRQSSAHPPSVEVQAVVMVVMILPASHCRAISGIRRQSGNPLVVSHRLCLLSANTTQAPRRHCSTTERPGVLAHTESSAPEKQTKELSGPTQQSALGNHCREVKENRHGISRARHKKENTNFKEISNGNQDRNVTSVETIADDLIDQ